MGLLFLVWCGFWLVGFCLYWLVLGFGCFFWFGWLVVWFIIPRDPNSKTYKINLSWGVFSGAFLLSFGIWRCRVWFAGAVAVSCSL